MTLFRCQSHKMRLIWVIVVSAVVASGNAAPWGSSWGTSSDSIAARVPSGASGPAHEVPYGGHHRTSSNSEVEDFGSNPSFGKGSRNTGYDQNQANTGYRNSHFGTNTGYGSTYRNSGSSNTGYGAMNNQGSAHTGYGNTGFGVSGYGKSNRTTPFGQGTIVSDHEISSTAHRQGPVSAISGPTSTGFGQRGISSVANRKGTHFGYTSSGSEDCPTCGIHGQSHGTPNAVIGKQDGTIGFGRRGNWEASGCTGYGCSNTNYHNGCSGYDCNTGYGSQCTGYGCDANAGSSSPDHNVEYGRRY